MNAFDLVRELDMARAEDEAMGFVRGEENGTSDDATDDAKRH